MHNRFQPRQASIHRRQSGVVPFNGEQQTDDEDLLDQIISSQVSDLLASRTSTPPAVVRPTTTAPRVVTTAVPATTRLTTSVVPVVVAKPTTTAPAAAVKPTTTAAAQQTTSKPASSVSKASSSVQPTGTAASSSTETKSSGPSPVAIGVTVTLILLMVGLAGVYFLRKYFIAKRQKKRQTWNVNAGADYSEKEQQPQQRSSIEDNYETIDINEKHGPTPVPYPFTIDNVNNQSSYPSPPTPPQHQQQQFYNAAPPAPAVALPAPPPPLHPTGLAPLRSPSPPPVAGELYNPFDSTPAPAGFDGPSALNAGPPVIPYTSFSSVTPVTTPAMIPTMAQSDNASSRGRNGALFTVIRTFVPSLPDELSLQPGEQVRVVEKYDDGWALCERMSRGAGVESGVVPVECLDMTSGDVSAIGQPQLPGSPAMSATGQYAGPPGSVAGMGMMQERVDSWRLSKRASSLHPVGAGKY